MRQRTQRRRVGTTLVAVALVGAACGGSTGEVLKDATGSSNSTTTSSIDVAETGVTTTGANASTTMAPTPDTITTTPDTITTTTGNDSAGNDSTGVTSSTVAPPEVDDDIDESRLALAANALYTLPGSGAPCTPQPDRVHAEYLFPAAGGDLYMMCVLVGDLEAGDPIGPLSLMVTRPDGSTAIDATVTSFQDGASVVVDPAGRSPLVLGVYGFWGSGNKAMIPMFLPHDRPAGEWTVASDGASSRLRVDRPCAGHSAVRNTDPLDVPPDLEFSRGGSFDFEHCRAFPDVTGLSVSESLVHISTWADVLGVSADVAIDAVTSGGEPRVGECGPESLISTSAPLPREVYRWFVGLPEHPVALTIDEDDCVPVETDNDADAPSTTDGSEGPDVDDADDAASTNSTVADG